MEQGLRHFFQPVAVVDISVIIPTFDRARLLVRAIRSVLGQSRPVLEVIVVDDGSTDGTEAAVAALGEDRVRYVRQERRGANAARNLGATLAGGDWLAFQDSDDYWAPDKIERQAEALDGAEAPCDAGFCGVLEFSGENAGYFPKGLPPDPTIFAGERHIVDLVLRRNLISTQTLLIRKGTFAALGGFDARLPRFQDWDLAVKLLSSARVLYLPEPLVIAGKGADSITRNYRAGLIARRQIWQNHRQLFRRHPAAAFHFRRDLAMRDLAGLARGR